MFDGSGQEVEACFFTAVEPVETEETQALYTQPLISQPFSTQAAGLTTKSGTSIPTAQIYDDQDEQTTLQRRYVGKLLKVYGHLSYSKLRGAVQIKLIRDPEILGEGAHEDVQAIELEEAEAILQYRRRILDVDWKPIEKDTSTTRSKQPPLPGEVSIENDPIDTPSSQGAMETTGDTNGYSDKTPADDETSMTSPSSALHNVSRPPKRPSSELETTRASKLQKEDLSQNEPAPVAPVYSPSWPSDDESEFDTAENGQSGVSTDALKVELGEGDIQKEQDSQSVLEEDSVVGLSELANTATKAVAPPVSRVAPPEDSDDDWIFDSDIEIKPEKKSVPKTVNFKIEKNPFKIPPPEESDDEFIQDDFSANVGDIKRSFISPEESADQSNIGPLRSKHSESPGPTFAIPPPEESDDEFIQHAQHMDGGAPVKHSSINVPPPDESDDEFIEDAFSFHHHPVSSSATSTIPPPEESDDEFIQDAQLIGTDSKTNRAPVFVLPPEESDDEFIADPLSYGSPSSKVFTSSIPVPDEDEDEEATFIQDAFDFKPIAPVDAYSSNLSIKGENLQSSLSLHNYDFPSSTHESSQFAVTQELLRAAERSGKLESMTEPDSDSEPEETRIRASNASYDRLMHCIRSFINRHPGHCASLCQILENPRLRKYAGLVNRAARRNETMMRMARRMRNLMGNYVNPDDQLLVAVTNDLVRVGLMMKRDSATKSGGIYEGIGPWNLTKPVRSVLSNQNKRIVLSNVEAVVRSDKQLRGHVVSRRLIEEMVEELLEKEHGHILWTKNDKQKFWSNQGSAY